MKRTVEENVLSSKVIACENSLKFGKEDTMTEVDEVIPIVIFHQNLFLKYLWCLFGSIM